MIDPVATKLKFAPTGQFIDATILALTPQMIEAQVMGSWWTDPDLKPILAEKPIDREWDWRSAQIEYKGRILASEMVAIIAGDGIVEGAMHVASEPIYSMVDPGLPCLLLEWLFTAPRNRPELRLDGKPYVMGAGSELLVWAARFSRDQGCDGWLRLDASPASVAWYERRGLQKAGAQPIVFEGISYTPMELIGAKALELL